MGWSVSHVSKKGRTTYRSYFRDTRGETVYEGTYATEKESDKAWQIAEARIADGRIVDAKGGRVKFEQYVTDTWFPNHVIEQSSADDYEYRIRKYLKPWFGPLPMNQIYPADVREWVTWMRKDQGVSPVLQRPIML